MNNNRRKKLLEVVSMLEVTSNIVDIILNEEQDSLDNIPENLTFGDAYDKIEEAIDCLENALDSIEEAKEGIENACK